MARILHLVKDPMNRVAFDVIGRQARDPSNALVVVLLQTAAGLTEPLPGEVFRLGQGNGPSPYPAIDHSRLLDLIFGSDTVVTW